MAPITRRLQTHLRALLSRALLHISYVLLVLRVLPLDRVIVEPVEHLLRIHLGEHIHVSDVQPLGERVKVEQLIRPRVSLERRFSCSR